LGGEPLIQQDFSRLVDFIEQHPNPKLEFNVVTNLIVKKQNLVNQIEKLKSLIDTNKIKRVDILCSVDSWGPEQEYVRTGFNCEQFDENFKYLAQFKWIRLGLLSTVNSLSIQSMPLLAEKFQDWSKINEIFWYMHFVLPFERHVLTPMAFDYFQWETALEKVNSSLVGDTFDINSTKQTLNGIITKLKNSQPSSIMQKQLVDYLNKIDQRRNTNWQETFPWLTGALDNVV
jgi:uncharacterized coiled-coil protein SlyX